MSNISILSPTSPSGAIFLPLIVDASIFSINGLTAALNKIKTTFVAIGTSFRPFQLSEDTLFFLEDWLSSEENVSMLYANYVLSDENNVRKLVLLNEPEQHILRDSFDFGPLIFTRTADALQALKSFPPSDCSALYALTLGLQRLGAIAHSDMLIGTISSAPSNQNGQFDYVDPRNRSVQIDRERIATSHLVSIGATVNHASAKPFPADGNFPVEASVIIPVKNRKNTIADAVHSALDQKTSFPFNVLVVDNHSSDGTSDVLSALAQQDSRLIHIIPSESDLGIGGCWNRAISDPLCGRYAVQLDSDDLYSSPSTLQTIIDKFHEAHYALVVGSYKLVDFSLNEIPPGIIDHKEWSDDNGANNILRINGMGAPRAFCTNWLRQFPLPNVSYGEDYAAVLRATREFLVGRIFDVLYLCRRWTGNSDSCLTPEKENAHNAYKDSLRSAEVVARISLNKSKL